MVPIAPAAGCRSLPFRGPEGNHREQLGTASELPLSGVSYCLWPLKKSRAEPAEGNQRGRGQSSPRACCVTSRLHISQKINALGMWAVPGHQHLSPCKHTMSVPDPREPPRERRWHLQEGGCRNWSCIFSFSLSLGAIGWDP